MKTDENLRERYFEHFKWDVCERMYRIYTGIYIKKYLEVEGSQQQSGNVHFTIT